MELEIENTYARIFHGDFDQPEVNGTVLPTFNRVAIIGAGGKVGSLITENLSQVPGLSVDPVFRGGIATEMAKHPDLVILATPNPADQPLEELAAASQEPYILVLMQNGIGVASVAERKFKLAKSRGNVRIARVLLRTTLAEDEEGHLIYDPKQKKIALSPVYHKDEPDAETDLAVEQTSRLFAATGFEVTPVNNFRTAELGKNVLNSLGLLAAVLPGYETWQDIASDRKLFGIAHEAICESIDVPTAAGKKPAEIWEVGKLKMLARVPARVINDQGVLGNQVRETLGNKLAKARNNLLPATAVAIKNGAKEVEATESVLAPIIHLASGNGLEAPVHRAIYQLLKRHASSRNSFSLTDLTQEEQRQELLDIVELEKDPVFVEQAQVRGIPYKKILLEALFNHYADTVTITGEENLAPITETLEQGLSFLLLSNHRGHADHALHMIALRKSLPASVRHVPVYIVANRIFDIEDISNWFSAAYAHPIVSTLNRDDNEETEWRAQIFNDRALKKMRIVLKEPAIVLVYPEGTRNRHPDDGLNPPAFHSSDWLFNANFGRVGTAAVSGTEKMLTPGAGWPQHADLTIHYNETEDPASLRKERIFIPRDKRDEYFMGRFMKQIEAALVA